MTAEAGSQYDGMNARALTPTEVGQGFVYASHFKRLVTTNHSIVVGPRGSGKTTLLKMLQLPALDVWHGKRADRIIADLNFIGVFIPTDLVWQAQIQGATSIDEGSPYRNHLQSLGLAAFNAHVLMAGISSIRQRCELEPNSRLERFRFSLSPKSEKQLAVAIAECLNLDLQPASLKHLIRGIAGVVVDIGRARRRASRLGEIQMSRSIESVLDIDILQAIALAFGVAEDFTGAQPVRWALCFDELELCPDDIRLRILHLLRSTDQRLLFKLTMSPCGSGTDVLDSPGKAQAGHDYELISLTHGRRFAMEAFARDLTTRLLRAQMDAQGDVDPVAVFGRSITAPGRTTAMGREAYAKGSRQQLAIERLYLADRSFRAYLDGLNIDPDKLDEVPKARLHKLLRKTIHYVSIRDAYRRSDSGAAPRHQSYIPYAGVPLMYAMTEGNPRLVIGMVNAMLLANHGRVSASDQSVVYAEMISRQRSLYRTIGAPTGMSSLALTSARSHIGTVTVIRFLDVVGEYFRQELVDGDFSTDPPGTFLVDDASAGTFGRLIATAVNAGALIHVSNRESRVLASDGDLVGERFRLSYLLGAYHRLPLRLDRPVNLSTIVAFRREDGTQVLPGLEGDKDAR